MSNNPKFIVSHAPFVHYGSSLQNKTYHTIFAALPAVIVGLLMWGVPAMAVIALSVGCSIIWEYIMNLILKRPQTVDDGNAALVGLLFAMLLPATVPWWLVVLGSAIAIIIGKMIFGGIGGNPFSPPLLAIAIIMVSWPHYLDFNVALTGYDFDFSMVYPLTAARSLGSTGAEAWSTLDLLLGKQSGGIGSTFSLGLILGGVYLILRGFIRWEIALSFIGGVAITALMFNMADPVRFAGPVFHVLTGYTLIGAFFLATDDASSPVSFLPMILYGIGGGFLTVLIRNIGTYYDGVVFAIILMNTASPLFGKIKPKAFGRVE